MEIIDSILESSVQNLREHPQNQKFYSKPDPKEWETLLNSIKEIGIQEPLWITKTNIVVSGHQRLKVAKSIGLETVPTRLVVATEEEIMYLLIMSNEARRGKEQDAMKEARKVKFLKDFWGIRHGNNGTFHSEKSYEDIAKEVGKSVATVHRLERLNELIPELQEMVSDGKIGLLAGCDLAVLPKEDQQKMFKGMSRDVVKRTQIRQMKPLNTDEQQQQFKKLIGRISRNVDVWCGELSSHMPNQQAEMIMNALGQIQAVIKGATNA
jgi:ParB family transcriptional regulator, chromosome partitioning protein